MQMLGKPVCLARGQEILCAGRELCACNIISKMKEGGVGKGVLASAAEILEFVLPLASLSILSLFIICSGKLISRKIVQLNLLILETLMCD